MNEFRTLHAAELAIALMWAAPEEQATDEQRRAFELCAQGVIERVIATQARCVRGLAVKAEAVAWCNGSRSDFALGDTLGERVIGSLLADLLRPAAC